MAYWWNGGPTEERILGRPFKLWWTRWNYAFDVVRDDSGNWESVQYQVDDAFDSYAYVLRGGRRAEISSAIRAELITAGYGAYIETV